MTTTPDPETVRKIARRSLQNDIHRLMPGWFTQGVGRVLRDEAGPGMTRQDFEAWFNAVCDQIRAAQITASWPDEQPQDERDATVPDDLWWPFTGGMDTCFSEHDGEYRECCWRAGLAYVLKLREEQVRATAQDERDGDVRAVAALLDATAEDAQPRNWTAARAMVRARFADRIAELEARDTKAGEQR